MITLGMAGGQAGSSKVQTPTLASRSCVAGSIIAAPRHTGACGAFLAKVSKEVIMPIRDKEKQPAYAPGDAQPRPKGEKDRTAKEGVQKTDKTEPVRTPHSEPVRNH
jgi:hypothetical protein